MNPTDLDVLELGPRVARSILFQNGKLARYVRSALVCLAAADAVMRRSA